MRIEQIAIAAIMSPDGILLTKCVCVDELGHAHELVGPTANKKWAPLPALPRAEVTHLAGVMCSDDRANSDSTFIPCEVTCVACLRLMGEK